VLAFFGFGSYRDQLLDYDGDWLSRIDLMRASFAEQRLDLGEIAEDRFAFLVVLSDIVGRSQSDPAKQHIGQRAEQDDVIELRVETT
jgi:hypothetical protein